ncbi:MFS transporter [Longispora albida]|uniref:MFS transporter n=1 Tax=Longispora albida TaxID=203523 RepID=UPI00036DCEBA|nr:MFS transporter [Longispora albida]
MTVTISQAPASPSPPATRRPGLILAVLLLGTFLVTANATLVTAALPATAHGLGAELPAMLWVINGYLVAFTALLPAAGRLGDRYGPRTLLLAGLAIFAVASAACALAPTGPALVAARVLQGAGAALLTPQALTILTHTYPPERRGRAFGVWGVVAGLAVAAGPLLGGAAVQYLGWRWVYGLVLAVAGLAFVLSAAVLPRARAEAGVRPRFDVLGTVLLAVALVLTVNGLLTDARLIVPGVVALIVFAEVQRRRQAGTPLIPFSVLRAKHFVLMAVVGGALSCAVAGMVLLTVVYLQSVAGLDALGAGLVVAVGPAVSVPFAPLSGWLTDRYGGRSALLSGLLLMTGGLAYLPVAVHAGAGWPGLLPGLVVFGIGMGVVFAPPSILAMSAVPAAQAGAASGTLTTLRTLGNTIGSVGVGALLQARFAATLTAADLNTASHLHLAVTGSARAGIGAAVATSYLLPVAVLTALTIASAVLVRPRSAV